MTKRKRSSKNAEMSALMKEVRDRLDEGQIPIGGDSLYARLQLGLRIPAFGCARHVLRSRDGTETREEFFPDRTGDFPIVLLLILHQA